MADRLAPSTAGIAPHLHLLIHARRKLMLHDANTMALASLARIDLTIRTPCTLTGLANVLLVPDELGRGAVVEVSLGNLDLDLDVVAPRLAGGASKVAVAAEEAAEEVKGVVAAAAAPAAVAEVLDALVAGAVVDLAGFGVAEDVVGFGDFDKLLMGLIVAGVLVGVPFL